ncbi:MAG: hypothetical protein CMJ70_00980 [Planctomycetaceae bacterium]|nr:hypothetical protein [Planctomycetaceae bacterium]HAA70607.1 hypothetical protein [Planctomycetaceae bacterium]|tara:strand:- start:37269 stop:38075 length:807 start_codon:yes stop_codon:yes gene_type:complete
MDVNPTRALRRPGYFEEIFAATVFATLFSMVALAGFLVLRRYGGALASLPASSMRLGTMATLLALATVRLFAAQQAGRSWLRFGVAFPFLLSPVAAVGLTIALCSWPASSNVLCWSALLVSEGGWGAWSVRRWATRQATHTLPTVPRTPLPEREEIPQRDIALAVAGEELPEAVFQQSSRARNAEGGEVLEFYCRSFFPPDERSQTVHLAFCPPLDSIPHLTVDHVAGSPASFKIAEVQSYGARIEVRLAGTRDHRQEVVIHVHGEID